MASVTFGTNLVASGPHAAAVRAELGRCRGTAIRRDHRRRTSSDADRGRARHHRLDLRPARHRHACRDTAASFRPSGWPQGRGPMLTPTMLAGHPPAGHQIVLGTLTMRQGGHPRTGARPRQLRAGASWPGGRQGRLPVFRPGLVHSHRPGSGRHRAGQHAGRAGSAGQRPTATTSSCCSFAPGPARRRKWPPSGSTWPRSAHGAAVHVRADQPAAGRLISTTGGSTRRR